MKTNPGNFYVGYGELPQRDRRFLIKAIPAGLLGLAVSGFFLGARAVSQGGGQWETGTPVTLTGRLGFNPYPTLWVEGKGIVLAGIGKTGADTYTRPLEHTGVQVKGIKITRGNCFMLGVAEGDIRQSDQPVADIPAVEDIGRVSLIGEALDAQCFMGIMNPGYGRTHRGCATLCVRGGQPVYFSPGINGSKGKGGNLSCGGIGYVLTAPDRTAANSLLLDKVSVPLTVSGRLERIGNLVKLVPDVDGIQRLG